MLVFGTGSEVLMPFLRSFLLAHLIAPNDFGLATALAVASGFVEVIADVGLNTSAMRQSRDASMADYLATLHTILVMRAVIVALILALGGVPLAQLFHAPEAAWSFSLLGLAAFVRGFSHLQCKEMMRDFQYGPDAVVNASGQIIWTLVTVAAAVILQDYRCMLIGMIASAAGQMVVSHLVATEPYRLGWSRGAAREALVYGAPLIPNGVAIALSGMGDRFFIGSMLGLNALAVYNIVSMASYMPRNVVLRLVTAVAVPAFIRKEQKGELDSRAFDYWVILLGAISSIYALSFLCFGSVLVGLVFGHAYEPTQELAGLFAASVYLKFLIFLPTPTALAYGQTRFVLATSVISGIAILVGAAVTWHRPDLSGFVLGVAAWETLALAWIVARSIKLYPFSARTTWLASFGPLLVLGAAQWACSALPPDDVWPRLQTYLLGGVILALAYAGLLFLLKLPLVPAFMRRA
jgi:PST family polysaccharide transporter